MEEVHILDQIEQVKVLADPHRIAILRQLMRGPATITQVGRRFGEEPAKARYHIKELERAGLVRLVEKREKGGTLEKYYEAVARRFVVNITVLADGPEDAFNAVTSGILRDLTTELCATVGTLARDQISGGWPSFQASATAYLNPARAEELRAELQQLLDRFNDQPDNDNSIAYGLAMLLYQAPREETKTLVAMGSHDLTLDLLAYRVAAGFPGTHVSTTNLGSLGGLMALHRGAAHLAGCHLIDPETGEYNVPYVRRLLPGQKVVLVNLAYRQQGLITAPGNPKQIDGLSALLRPGISFINRERGSGTRVLLDLKLREQGLDSRRIDGYDREEYTHVGVAAAIRDGRADVGLGILAAARANGLDFFPLARERYDLVMPRAHYESELMSPLLETLRSDSFKAEVMSLGGYDTVETGQVVAEL